MGAGPGEEILHGPGVDDALRSDVGLGDPSASVAVPGELAASMGIGIDRDLHVHRVDHRKHPARWVEPFRSTVHLHGLVQLPTCCEYELGIEGALVSTATFDEPTGAMAENVHVGVRNRGDHARGHRPRFHTQL